MRTRSFATLGTLALLAAASAFGQQRLRADIPFEFNVAGTVLPAGNYEVTCTGGVVQVRSHALNALSIANNITGGSGESIQPRLMFNKYGDKYFLAEVWSSPDSMNGAALLQSKAERETARGNPRVARIAVPLRTGTITLASLR